ncbi:MAG TPA: M15 family metallopeptidase [Thermoanaerobaculia bacterium]|nr:M15 family metallopeptidase [Thermoanaerobaculia bacterium]
MQKRINFAALLLALACSTEPPVPRNHHGLPVVPDLATYERLVRLDPEKRLVDLASIPGLHVDVRYATSDNFMKRQLYPVAKAYLRAPAAAALRAAQEELASKGLGLKVWDGYRPYRVTEALWESIRNSDYVADPARGSRHNRGAAVDLTLVDLRSGEELPMPTAYDDFTPRAAHAFTDLPPEVIANRARLREVMTRHGFDPLPFEWWHYDFRGWERFELMDVPLEAVSS